MKKTFYMNIISFEFIKIKIKSSNYEPNNIEEKTMKYTGEKELNGWVDNTCEIKIYETEFIGKEKLVWISKIFVSENKLQMNWFWFSCSNVLTIPLNEQPNKLFANK